MATEKQIPVLSAQPDAAAPAESSDATAPAPAPEPIISPLQKRAESAGLNLSLNVNNLKQPPASEISPLTTPHMQLKTPPSQPFSRSITVVSDELASETLKLLQAICGRLKAESDITRCGWLSSEYFEFARVGHDESRELAHPDYKPSRPLSRPKLALALSDRTNRVYASAACSPDA